MQLDGVLPTKRGARPTAALAADTDRPHIRVGLGDSRSPGYTRCDGLFRTSMYMSTIRCWSAWKLPIG